MEEKEYMELYESCVSEVIEDDSIMFFKEVTIDGETYGEWGWNKKIETVKRHFLYVFILKSIFESNEAINGPINNDLLEAVLNSEPNTHLITNDIEEMFVNMFMFTLTDTNIIDFRKDAEIMCNFLVSNGYNIEYYVFESPKAAVNKIKEFQEKLPEGEIGIGALFEEN